MSKSKLNKCRALDLNQHFRAQGPVSCQLDEPCNVLHGNRTRPSRIESRLWPLPRGGQPG